MLQAPVGLGQFGLLGQILPALFHGHLVDLQFLLVQGIHIAYRGNPEFFIHAGENGIALDQTDPAVFFFAAQEQFTFAGKGGKALFRIIAAADKTGHAVAGGLLHFGESGVTKHLEGQFTYHTQREAVFVAAAQNADAVVFSQQGAQLFFQGFGRGGKALLIVQSFLIPAFYHHTNNLLYPYFPEDASSWESAWLTLAYSSLTFW